MATYTKNKLSGSTNGKQIKVAATATPGTLIHTAVSGTSSWDEVWIYVTNSSTAAVEITIEWGEATAPDGNNKVTIPPKAGLYVVVPGLILQNSLEVRAFAATTNVLLVSGYVNGIT